MRWWTDFRGFQPNGQNDDRNRLASNYFAKPPKQLYLQCLNLIGLVSKRGMEECYAKKITDVIDDINVNIISLEHLKKKQAEESKIHMILNTYLK